tara:strand:- start:8409 stop:8984 length:576 start_codon:yes stop_codon:yes gene_type:complete
MDNKLKPYNINSMRFNPPWYTPGNRQDRANNAWFGFIQMLTKMKYRRESLLRPLKLLEIGTHRGESTAMFAMSGVFDEIVTVDIQEYDSAVDRSIFDNVEYIIADSKEYHKEVADGYFDVVYIDGDHSKEGITADINNYKSKIKLYGTFAGHDYNEHWPHVVEAVDTLLGKPENRFPDGSFMKKITKELIL